MKPILYPAGETQFQSNGLGRLAEAIKCHVTEERNGQYELEMQYPITGRHYADLTEERMILSRHDDSDDLQPFRIYKITRPMNGIVTVSARHISYQLSKVAVMPFSAETCPDALSGMITHSVGDCPFSFWTDKLLEAHFSVDVPSSFRSLLGGVSGSILDVYGPGEYEWDKFTVKFHTNRGSDQDVYIRYGKNMTDVRKTTDTSNLWTGILPYWTGIDEAEQAVLVTLPEQVVYADTAEDYVYKMVIPVDFTSAFENQPTVEQLRSRAQAYVNANATEGIPVSIDVSFVALWQTEEYKNWAPLQRLKLCDTVTVYHQGLGIENKAKIVSVTYDVLLERYEKMTIGEIKSTLSDSIRQISEEIKQELPTATSVAQAISMATNILSGSTGGNILINTNDQGQPVELLAIDTANLETAVKILKLNGNGLFVTTTGYRGTYTRLMDMEGRLQGPALHHDHAASEITSGTLPVIRGGTGETSLASAASALFSATGSSAEAPADSDVFITGNAGSVVKKTFQNLWGYIKGKADALYASATHQHEASSITSGTIQSARLPVVSQGNAGIAPAPTADQSEQFLRGDGTWARPEDDSRLSLDGGVLTGPLTAAKGFNLLLKGTATDAQNRGAGANPRYFPAKWIFDTGHTAQDGDMFAIRIPGAGHDYGVYLSVDGGEVYYPVVAQGTTRLTTQFAVSTILLVVLEETGSAASVFALEGGNARITVSGGVWRVMNYYANSNTIPSAYCGTAAATAAKVASCTSYVPLEKSYLHVLVVYANTASSALTLNVNGKGAKPVFINGEISSASNNVLPAGTYLAYYDGSSYHFRTDGKIPGMGSLAYEEPGADIETIYLPTAREEGVPGGYVAYTVFNGIIYEKETSEGMEGGEDP